EAEQAVAGLRYPPEGVRGIATMNRACAFGAEARTYIETANSRLLGLIQIETEEGLRNVDAIAREDGIDVLFIGPSDLTHSIGIPAEVNHPRFQKALRSVSNAARSAGKYAGAFLLQPQDTQHYVELGYTFLCCGSDGGLLSSAARELLRSQGAARLQGQSLARQQFVP